MQNEFVVLLNKYLTGKAWLAKRPYTKDLEDRFYEKVKKPMAELVEQAESSQKAEFQAILRLCDRFKASQVILRKITRQKQSGKA